MLPLLLVSGSAGASQTPASYRLQVSLVCAGSTERPAQPVYVWPWVARPGPIPWRPHLTVAEALAAAGGLVSDARAPVGSWSRPQAVYVQRPMADDPDPLDLLYVCPLAPDGELVAAAAACTFELQVGDLVGISMNGTPGTLRVAPPTGPPPALASCPPPDPPTTPSAP